MYNTFYTNYMLVCVSPNDSLTFYSNSPLTTHIIICSHPIVFFFFFNDTATTEISPFPLHDALPISVRLEPAALQPARPPCRAGAHRLLQGERDWDDRVLTARAGRAHQQVRGRRDARGKSREDRSEEHTSELQSLRHLVCRLLLEKKK